MSNAYILFREMLLRYRNAKKAEEVKRVYATSAGMGSILLLYTSLVELR